MCVRVYVCVRMQSGVFGNRKYMPFDIIHRMAHTIHHLPCHAIRVVYLCAIYTFQAQIDSICQILNIIIAIIVIIKMIVNYMRTEVDTEYLFDNQYIYHFVTYAMTMTMA